MHICYHLFKARPEWKAQQKILWAEVRKDSRRGLHRFKIRDLLANGRCSQTVLGFLSTTHVGRLVRDVGSEVSEWELRELRERRELEGERRAEAEELGTGEEPPRFLPTPSFVASAGEE